MTILGVDPGVNGAVAILDAAGELLEVFDMPALSDGAKGRQAVNAPLLASLVFKSHATQAFCELVGPRPKEGAVGAFGFGRSRGVVEGVCGAAGVPVVMLAPPVWKRAAAIPPGAENKDLARARAIARWPAKADLFTRKKDVDRAEAALIALAGVERGKGPS